MIHDELGRRMKENYEMISKYKLVRRMPVIIRIDGKAFHTYTKGFVKPFDMILMESMQETMKYLCENIQGCVLGYHQSDEISLLLIDYKNLNSSAWFDNEVQKICSVASSMATAFFNRTIYDHLTEMSEDEFNELDNKVSCAYQSICEGKRLAMFDARCFNIPKEEVINYFYWRQVDAIRNSVQMVGRANFSHKSMDHKSTLNIKEMLLEKGIDFEKDFLFEKQRGTCCIKTKFSQEDNDNWMIDRVIPVFKGDGREYIEDILLSCEDA